MDTDVKEYRKSDGRPVLHENVIPHLNLYEDGQNISASAYIKRLKKRLCFYVNFRPVSCLKLCDLAVIICAVFVIFVTFVKYIVLQSVSSDLFCFTMLFDDVFL